MSEPKPARRISASRLKSMNECTYKFYASEYLRVPEKVWPKTHAGSCVHSVLEALNRDKNRDLYTLTKETQTIYSSPALTRLVRAWQYKTQMQDKIVTDIDPMTLVAINHTNFLDEGAVKRYGPEYEFDMTLSNGGKIKGFIDRMADFGHGRWIITDYKSQGKRFTQSELENSFQSKMYQWIVWKRFGALAEVHYIMLRFPPTKKEPTRHIQITMPPTEAQLRGFEHYLEHSYETIVQFGLQDAYGYFKEDEGFCRNVCTYFRPTDYISIKKRDTNILVGNYMPGTEPPLAADEYSEILHHEGCPKHNPQ